MRLSTAILALSCALVTITGCTSSKSSPERHAYAFVAHRSDFVGGNFTVNRQENYRLNLPTFTAMYARGQQGTRTEHAFTGNASDKWDNAMENKDAVLFGNELSGAYLDGYLGVK